MNKKIKITLLSIILLIFVFIFIPTLLIININKSVIGFSDDLIEFRVSSGETAYKIGNRLHKNNYIKSELFFKIICKINSKKQLKKGLYEINRNDTTLDIFDKLVAGHQKMVRITIPEGLTIKKTAALFNQAKLCSEYEFLNAIKTDDFSDLTIFNSNNLEGFLYPDTYLFPADCSANFIISAMIKQFNKIILEVYSPVKFLSKSDFFDYLILASIVQREYKIKKEAPTIASIFINRLELGMPLQSCATVEYIITELLNKPHPKRLFYSDLEIDSSYNSYLYSGLPPAPICSPGKIALKSTFSPITTNYLYFVVKNPKTGEHSFSSNLKSHNLSKEEYLKQYMP